MSALDHAYLPPSGAAAWVACAAWPSMNAAFPQGDSEDSLAGTAAHWAFEQELRGHGICEGQVAPNGATLTDEMVEGAELYVGAIDRALAEAGLDRSHLHIEERRAIPSIHDQNNGTPDTWFYDPVRGVLYMLDYKFGHKFVEVYANWQLIDYVAGVFDAMGLDGLQDQAIRVVFVIVQPRSYHREGPVRRWTCRGSDLRPYFNTLRLAAERAVMPNPIAATGDQCEYCPGRHACEALQRSAYQAAEISSHSVPVLLSAQAVGLELRMLERAQRRLSARVTGLQETALALITRPPGARVPFYGVEPTQGREYWTKPAAEVLALGRIFGQDLSKPGLITPKQATAKGLPDAIVAAYIGRNSGALKLVPDDGTQAAKVFSLNN